MFIWFHCDWFYILAVEQICLSLFYGRKQNSRFLPWNLVPPHCVSAWLHMCLFGMEVPALCRRPPPREELPGWTRSVTWRPLPLLPSSPVKASLAFSQQSRVVSKLPRCAEAAQANGLKTTETRKQGSCSEASSCFQSLSVHGTCSAVCCPPEKAVTSRLWEGCPGVGCAATWGLLGQNDFLCALTPQSSRLNHSIKFMYFRMFPNQEKDLPCFCNLLKTATCRKHRWSMVALIWCPAPQPHCCP